MVKQAGTLDILQNAQSFHGLFTRGWQRALGIALVKGVQRLNGGVRDCKLVPPKKTGKLMLKSTS